MGVPRGMLRPITLVLLTDKPMSGSEVAEEIEHYAEWKPSPGSIYPLLNSLQEDGLIEPNEDSDPSLKRFSLTAKGAEEVKLHKSHDKEIRNRSKNMRKVYWRLFRQMPEDVYESFVGLLDRIEESYDSIDDLAQFKEILDKTLLEIKKLDKKQNE
jgi:DNA-binding PadR family transcriptional regulator